jgi:hypothetical protein
VFEFKPLTTKEEWRWFNERTHTIWCADTQGIVVRRGGDIQAVAVFDSWTVDACSVHFAIANPMVIRRGFLNEIGRHLFLASNRKRIFGLVPDNNAKAIKFDQHIGMRIVAHIPDALSEGVGYHVMRMDKEDCRWIEQPSKEEAA